MNSTTEHTMAKKRKNKDEGDINVTLFRRNDKGDYIMQYADPVSGRKRRKTTGTDKLREAKKIRDLWQASIAEGKDWSRGKMSWEEFRSLYEENKLSSLAPKSMQKTIGVLNVLDRIIGPRRLRDVNGDSLDTYQAKLRKGNWVGADGKKKQKPRSEHTIKGHLSTIRAALSWAKMKGWIKEVPQMPYIQQAKNLRMMKGRPITDAEFESMLEATREIIIEPNKGRAAEKIERKPDESRIESWQYLLKGLWLSGLRLTEAMELHWNDRSVISVDFTGRRPMFYIPQGADKSKSDKILPMAPEFAVFLDETPQAERNGFVFNPIPQNKKRKDSRLSVQQVGRIISEIGEAAEIVVNDKSGSFASAHDLRRSFGQRWKAKLMPARLAELMRHKSISTTMKYYVTDEAEETADALWGVYESAIKDSNR